MTLAVSPGAPKRAAKAPAKPFTLPHFRGWAADLILDTGESWHPEAFFEEFLEDVFAGIPECWLIVPEGNTKTTSLAGLALYHAEHRPQASVPVAASSRDQAEVLYRQAEGFVIRSERLHGTMFSPVAQAKGKRKTDVPRFQCLEGYRRINHYAGGRIQIFAADEGTGDGQIPTLGLLDELHRHRDLGLYRTWAGKLEKRGGQLAAISTRGEPGSDFEETIERIRREAEHVIRRGSFTRAVSPRLVMHMWAVPEKADPQDMAVVKAANPFTGITEARLATKFKSPTMTLPYWLRYVCNRPQRGESSAVTEEEWRKRECREPIPEHEPVNVGIDVAWKIDTTALVPLWAPRKEQRRFGKPEILTPPRDGSMLDPNKVEIGLMRIHERNPIAVAVMDTNRAEQLASWIESELGAVVVDRTQSNYWAALEYEAFMEALRLGWIEQPADPEFTTHVLNGIARQLPGGGARFDRPVQSRRSVAQQQRRVIDALTAASMVNLQASLGFAKPAEKPGPAFVSY